VSVKIVKKMSLWFERNARLLPWRENPDPYRVWLSEVMLQQTRVTTVIPYFERFLAEFPEITDLAEAPIDRVLTLWAGLGYYSRARNLHRGAKGLAERIRRGAGFPETREEWLEIPGVGEYTAGAVLSIAFQKREPIVDGNVVRVLSRIHAVSKIDSKKSEIWAISRALIEEKSARPRILNQALMELGALICTPKNPDCNHCPVAKECKGRKDPESFPPKKSKKEWKIISETRFVILRSGRGGDEVLLRQNPDGGWRSGLWDFPAKPEGSIQSQKWVSEFQMNYVVTNHRVARTHRVFRIPEKSSIRDLELRWFSIQDLPAVPAPVKKAILRLVD
jgi:A/G-specific adenine glycosylase